MRSAAQALALRVVAAVGVAVCLVLAHRLIHAALMPILPPVMASIESAVAAAPARLGDLPLPSVVPAGSTALVRTHVPTISTVPRVSFVPMRAISLLVVLWHTRVRVHGAGSARFVAFVSCAVVVVGSDIVASVLVPVPQVFLIGVMRREGPSSWREDS